MRYGVIIVLAIMLLGACARDEHATVQGKTHTESVAPAGKRTLEQMQEYEKTHPPSKEQRAIPIMPAPKPGN